MPATISPALFRFLKELAAHNDREWFSANKERYLSDVRDPLLAFVGSVAPRLCAVSPHVVADARPAGGTLLRIYRDTRFSRNKKPYKTNAALYFRHDAGRDIHAPGYYLHLEPGQVFMGAGMWHPDADALRAVRETIVADPRGWKAARRVGLSHGDESLKRPPRGFDAEHPLIEDLKRTSFTTGVEYSERLACASDFATRFVADCRRQAPLMKFLAGALNLTF